MGWFESLVLGIVQGLTEFLPVSSDGHLTIVQKGFDAAYGKTSSGELNLFFDIMLHVGTLAAIVLYFRRTAVEGVRGFLRPRDARPGYHRNELIHIGVLVFVALLPLIPYVKFKHVIEQALESLVVTGCGFLVTAAATPGHSL